MMAQFAGRYNTAQATDLLTRIAEVRIQRYADWAVKYELVGHSHPQAAEQQDRGRRRVERADREGVLPALFLRNPALHPGHPEQYVEGNVAELSGFRAD